MLTKFEEAKCFKTIRDCRNLGHRLSLAGQASKKLGQANHFNHMNKKKLLIVGAVNAS